MGRLGAVWYPALWVMWDVRVADCYKMCRACGSHCLILGLWQEVGRGGRDLKSFQGKVQNPMSFSMSTCQREGAGTSGTVRGLARKFWRHLCGCPGKAVDAEIEAEGTGVQGSR